MNESAAIYARVSTEDQAERGYSLPSQVEACEKFASQQGWVSVLVYQDDISGTTPVNLRPSGYELQKEIDAGSIQAVIVYQVDRLSRDIVDLLTTVRKWLQAGVGIYALDMGRITSENDIMLVIKGWQGGDERQKIRERTMRGKSTKAKAGKVVGEGVPPYGYISQDGEFLINDEEAQVVRMIYEWYINGDENGRMMSMMNVARKLTALSIPTPAKSKGMTWRANKNGMWHFITVRWILSSETYCGVLRWGRRVSRAGRLENRSPEEQIPIEVPAIISREAWELAQERRVYNSKIARRRMKHEYLLRGMLFCGCGRRMVGTKADIFAQNATIISGSADARNRQSQRD